MEDKILFEAKIDKWSCKNEKKIDENKPMEVAMVLAEIHDLMDQQIWESVGKEMDTKKLDAIADEITNAVEDSNIGKAKALSKVSSPTTTRKMDIKGKKAVEIAKTYLSRRILKNLGMKIELDPKLAKEYMK